MCKSVVVLVNKNRNNDINDWCKNFMLLDIN